MALGVGFLGDWERARRGSLLVKFFKLDEALLPLIRNLGEIQKEPSILAAEVSEALAYDYLGWVADGECPTRWFFSLRTRFSSDKERPGWYIPEYPWLQHIGGPALLELDSDILLVSEDLWEPRPYPILPGAFFPEPVIWPRDLSRPWWLHHYPVREGALVDIEQWLIHPADERRPFIRFFKPPIGSRRANAWLPKFGRARYPVLIGLRPQTVTKEQILVRTWDGIPLLVPNIAVDFDLFHQGYTIRAARRQFPREVWQEMAWQATLRLIQREAYHWAIHSATDLAAYVLQNALGAAFRRVFSRYPAAKLLDRVQRQVLEEILEDAPLELRRRVEEEVYNFVQNLKPIPWEHLRDEILAELNGTKENGYAQAEARGLFVTRLSFGEWKLPGVIREANREAMRHALAWVRDASPVSRQRHYARASQAEVQYIVDLLVRHLPGIEARLEIWFSSMRSIEFITWLRRGWLQVLGYLIDGVASHPDVAHLFKAEQGFRPTISFEAELLDSSDARLRHINLVAWLLHVQHILETHPWSLAGEPGDMSPPEDFLGGAHS